MFLSFIGIAHAESSWVMTKCSLPLSYYVDFDCSEDDALINRVTRSGLFTPRYYYDLYSADGAFLARAINRVFSFGLFFPGQMEFDVYDERDKYIGYIGGKLWTNGNAKFGFLNAKGIEMGLALLSSDSDQAIFSILSPHKTIVATLYGSLSGDLSSWNLDMKKSIAIDSRVLKIFAAFICDFHESFIRKPEVHNHYYNNRSDR